MKPRSSFTLLSTIGLCLLWGCGAFHNSALRVVDSKTSGDGHQARLVLESRSNPPQTRVLHLELGDSVHPTSYSKQLTPSDGDEFAIQFDDTHHKVLAVTKNTGHIVMTEDNLRSTK